MDFITKQLNRVGKTAENFQITFKPLLLKVSPYASAEFYVVFKRGLKKDETKKYRLEPSTQLQHVKFLDVIQKTSGFYKERDGSYQPKKAEIIVRAVSGMKDDKICEVSINLSSYIGRGAVNDSQSLSGSAFFIDFEISVEPATKATAEEEDSDELEKQSSDVSGSSPTSNYKNSDKALTLEQRQL